jgi:hypothetical protein
MVYTKKAVNFGGADVENMLKKWKGYPPQPRGGETKMFCTDISLLICLMFSLNKSL